MAKRAFLIVLDSVGIGEMPDAANWGDEGSNTLGAIRNHPEFYCPNLKKMGLFAIDGIGEVIAKSIAEYFRNEKNMQMLSNLLAEVTVEKPEENTNAQIFEGMNFVITGSVTHFANRNEVKAVIEARGGKVTGSVTSKTNSLINNDTTSNSSKNKKAKELNIPIISEEDFLEMLE